MAADQRPHKILGAIGYASLALVNLIAAEPSSAEIKTIAVTGVYRMGDNDTRTDADYFFSLFMACWKTHFGQV